MWQSISRVLREQQIHIWGTCAFAPLQAHLLPCRAASRLPTNPQAVIVCLFPYRVNSDAPRNLSRYACVPDYHRIVGNTLTQAADTLRTVCGYAFEPFVDNSPIPEVLAAARAGLGCIGDNGLLIHPQYGSYVFIGTLVTDAPLSPTDTSPASCIHCGACTRACPTQSLLQGHLCKETCLSAVSQKKGSLTKEETRALIQNGLVWGCDRCQEVCPLNRTAVCAPFIGFDAYEPFLSDVPAPDILAQKPYGWRGAAVLERNLTLLYHQKS